MRICIGQTNPIKGDIEKNIEQHIKFLDTAIRGKADIVVFPELSLTGYEPELAKDLATTQDDERLDVFQSIADLHELTIGVGLPTRENNDVHISIIVFQPKKSRLTYSKRYLYPPEVACFTPGKEPVYLNIGDHVVAPAICYELSNPEHAEAAYKNKANIYIASVLNSVGGVDGDLKKLSAIASNYRMTVFMANFVGQSGGYECAGKSSVWDATGNLMGQLDSQAEGILIYDTETKEAQLIKE